MSNVNFSSGLPETVLPSDPLDATLADGAFIAYEELAEMVGRHPKSLVGWAALGEISTDPIVRYAFFRSRSTSTALRTSEALERFCPRTMVSIASVSEASTSSSSLDCPRPPRRSNRAKRPRTSR